MYPQLAYSALNAARRDDLLRAARRDRLAAAARRVSRDRARRAR